jgi:hypothetical protein
MFSHIGCKYPDSAALVTARILYYFCLKIFYHDG